MLQDVVDNCCYIDTPLLSLLQTSKGICDIIPRHYASSNNNILASENKGDTGGLGV